MRFWPHGRAMGWRLRRGLVAALLIANQFAVASGLPLPVYAAASSNALKKDLSKPYPCMNLPCGCLNADQCWHSCCCFTMREKLAWAEANGVEPPEFVREAAAREALADAKTCCKKKHCCCHCQSHASPADNKAGSDKPVRKSNSKSVILLMALGCRSQNLFSILAQALPVARRPMLRYEALPVGVVSFSTASFASYSEAPAVPPPERCIAARIASRRLKLG